MPAWGFNNFNSSSGIVIRLEIAQKTPLLVGFTFTPNSRTTKDLLRQHTDKFVWRSDLGRYGLHTFPFSQKSQRIVDLKNILGRNGSRVSVKDLDSRAKTAIEQPPDTSHEVDWNQIPKGITDVLYPFQREGVEYALKRKGRALIADDMGLGKTIQAIAVSSYYKPEWPVLVVCPSSVRLNWRAEYVKWMHPHVSEKEINVVLKGKQPIRYHQKDNDGKLLHMKVAVVSYGLVAKKIAEIKEVGFKIIILDESHYIKSDSAQRTKALLPLLKKKKSRVLLLTGTPAMSRPIELYTQVEAIKPGLLGRKKDYGQRYCGAKQVNYGRGPSWEYKGATNLTELHLLLKNHCMIRRLKTEVLTDLPPKTRVCVKTEVNVKKINNLKSQLDDVDSLLKGAVNQGGAAGNNEQRKLLVKLYGETGKAKIAATKEFVTELIESEKKFLVFAHHHAVLDALEDHVKSKKVEYFRIDGKTKAKDRQAGIEAFQEKNSRMRVAILSITAAGQGITLTAADLVVFAELHWTPANLIQAEDRVNRIGQPNATTMYYIIAKNSLDDQMWPMISHKMRVLGSCLDGRQSSMKLDRNVGNFKEDNRNKSETGSQRKRKRSESLDKEPLPKRPNIPSKTILRGQGIDQMVLMGYDKSKVQKAAKLVYERFGTQPSEIDRFVPQAMHIIENETLGSCSQQSSPRSGSKQQPIPVDLDSDSSDDYFFLTPPENLASQSKESVKKKPRFGSGIKKGPSPFGKSNIPVLDKPQLEDTIPCEICHQSIEISKLMAHQQNCLSSQNSQRTI